VVRRLLSDWPGRYRHVANRPALSLPGNINRAVELATGQWILQLHDDDYLLPDAGAVISRRSAARRLASGCCCLASTSSTCMV
jgi:glycosyltransferase involved in cell wall biosynthesis